MNYSSAMQLGINWSSLTQLPENSSGFRTSDPQRLEMIVKQGYQGVQGGNANLIRAAGLRFTDSSAVRVPSDAKAVARAAVLSKAEAVTIHVGTGFEDDTQMDVLLRAILEATQRHQVPIFIETHRATITQDAWRTVQAIKRFPDLRINLDFSHWYTGLEWAYGDMDAKLEFIAPVLDRVRYIHARIGSSGNIQVGLDEPEMERHGSQFQAVWTRAMQGFLAHATPTQTLYFVPELLLSPNNYARVFKGIEGYAEESDRWLESWRLAEIGEQCFAAALK
jgi:hypothetical protein